MKQSESPLSWTIATKLSCTLILCHCPKSELISSHKTTKKLPPFSFWRNRSNLFFYFLAPFLFVFLSFLFSPPFYSVHPFFCPEKFDPYQWKTLERRPWSSTGIFWFVLPPILHQKLIRFFRFPALSECSRFSKWTVAWKDLANLYMLHITRICWRANWWRHKWLNDHFSKSRKNPFY